MRQQLRFSWKLWASVHHMLQSPSPERSKITKPLKWWTWILATCVASLLLFMFLFFILSFWFLDAVRLFLQVLYLDAESLFRALATLPLLEARYWRRVASSVALNILIKAGSITVSTVSIQHGPPLLNVWFVGRDI